MNVVIVLGPYFPHSTAVGICMSKIAEVLSIEHDVTVISLKNELNNGDIDIFKKHKIVRVATQNINWRNRIDFKISNLRGLSRIAARFQLRVQQSINLLKILTNKYGLDYQLIHQYQKMLEKTDVDLLIPCCIPFEAIAASMEYKRRRNKDVKLVPFLFDLYSQNAVMFRSEYLRKVKEKYTVSLEKQLVALSDKVFYTDNWNEHITSIIDSKEKIIYMEHPLITQIRAKKRNLVEKKSVNLVYQGECNNSMRPPDLVLAFFTELANYYSNFKLHFFGFGNAYNRVEAFENDHPGIIHSYGRVAKDVADSFMLDADILLVIGNLDSRILPSKVYECIASGKPILYFYHSEHDAPIRLLKRYPLCKVIRQGDLSSETVRKTIEWINRVKNSLIDFGRIRELYSDATPEYIVNQLLSAQ